MVANPLNRIKHNLAIHVVLKCYSGTSFGDPKGLPNHLLRNTLLDYENKLKSYGLVCKFLFGSFGLSKRKDYLPTLNKQLKTSFSTFSLF